MISLYDLIICAAFIIALFLQGKWMRKYLVDAISIATAEVVKNQWELMFKKLDSYKEKVDLHECSILDLKERCGKLENKEKIKKMQETIRRITPITTEA